MEPGDGCNAMLGALRRKLWTFNTSRPRLAIVPHPTGHSFADLQLYRSSGILVRSLYVFLVQDGLPVNLASVNNFQNFMRSDRAMTLSLYSLDLTGTGQQE
jgi:hypothetical protein